MVSGGSSKSRSKSSSKPWIEQQPYLKKMYSRAEELYKQGPYDYGPDRVAGFTDSQEKGLQMAEQRGMQGSSLTGAAQDQAEAELRGDYLDPEKNQALGRYAEMGARNLKRDFYGGVNALGSSMEGAGRTGSGGQSSRQNVLQENFATGLGDMNAQIYGGAYQADRGHQQAAGARANDLANQDYRDASAVYAAGQQRQEQRQKEVDELVGRFQQKQYGAADKLAEFGGMIGETVMTSKSKAKSTAWNFGVGTG